VALIWKTPRSDTLYDLRKNILLVLTEFVRYLLWGRGLFLLPLTQVMIFARSALLDDSSITQATGHEADGHKPENLPDIEIMPVATGASPKPEIQASVKEGATSLICVLLRPRSRGEVCLDHLDPRTRPQCHFNAMHDPEDMVTMKKAVRLGLALGAKIRDSGYPLGDFLVGTMGDDADMESLIKKNIMSTYHYASSCRMAPLAEGGVVNDRLQVHGIDGLRIADASVFPSIPAGHLQAPAVMVGEKCAAMIQADFTEAA
jgi:choline dehydrogenase